MKFWRENIRWIRRFRLLKFEALETFWSLIILRDECQQIYTLDLERKDSIHYSLAKVLLFHGGGHQLLFGQFRRFSSSGFPRFLQAPQFTWQYFSVILLLHTSGRRHVDHNIYFQDRWNEILSDRSFTRIARERIGFSLDIFVIIQRGERRTRLKSSESLRNSSE